MSRKTYFWNTIKNDGYEYETSNGNLFMSPAEVAKVAYDAGFRGEALLTMVAIAGRESGYSPVVHGSDASQSRVSGDRGLWQINYVHDKTLSQLGIISDTTPQGKKELFDPLTNAKAAFVLSNNGTDFSPWNAGPGGYNAAGNYLHGTDVSKAAEAVREAGLGAEIAGINTSQPPSNFPLLKTPSSYPAGTVFGLEDTMTQGELGNVLDVLTNIKNLGLQNIAETQRFVEQRQESDEDRPLGYSQDTGRPAGAETIRQIEGTEADILSLGQPSDVPVIDDPAFWEGIGNRQLITPTLDLNELPRNWLESAQELFPDYYWIIEQNPEIAEIIKDAIRGEGMSDAEFTAAIMNTDWYKTTSLSARNFDYIESTDPASAQESIDRTVAGLQQTALDMGIAFSTEELQDISRLAVRNNWSEQEILNELGSRAIATFGVSELSKGYTGQRMRKYQANYGIQLDDTTFNTFLEDIAIGEQNLNTFQDFLISRAKELYPTIAERLDQGESFQTAVDSYKTIAANLLERDKGSIDMTDPNFIKALTFSPDVKGGEERLMTNTEWERYLRSNKAFGYEFTDGARNEAAQVVTELGRVFGRI